MIEGNRVLAIIPARGGSKGIIGKNIVEIGGRPMISWTIEAAAKSKFIDRAILSSDDKKIRQIAQQFGCEVPFERPGYLSMDESPTIDVVLHALDHLPGYDIVVLLQPTSPLRSTEDIDGCLDLMLSTGAPACVSVAPASDHPYLTYQISDGNTMVAYSKPRDGQSLQRQKLPLAWVLNGAVYAARIDWLKVTRSFTSEKTVAFTMPIERSTDVDTIEDLQFVRSSIVKK
jgi:N-acylneuraminate cytidylyltransferase